MTQTTIFALSSGSVPAGVGIIRLSGPRATEALIALLREQPLPPARTAAVRRIHDVESGQLLDSALILRFTGPHSFTGEDVVEIHCHGSPAVVAGIQQTLCRLPGLRLAEAGEFTRRAFQSGRIDLTQAEALSDLIVAETAAQRDQALNNAGGRLRDLAGNWRDRIIDLMADAEADLDFSDEGDVAFTRDRPNLNALLAEIQSALASAAIGERVRTGLTIAIVGPPNAGKSSLINALSRRDVAIVTPIAGTTRDIIEVHLDLGGIPATLLDTAGLRETDDPVEKEGVARARARAATADLVLNLGSDDVGGMHIVNKIDLAGEQPGVRDKIAYISATTGAGLGALEEWLCDWARNLIPQGEPAVVSHARQAYWLGETVAALAEAGEQPDPVLHAESLRQAANALGRLTGHIDPEAVLGAIFSRFCIGK